MSRLRKKIRYLIDQAFASEFAGQSLLLLSLVVLVTLLGTSAVFFGLFSEENATALGVSADQEGNFENALWWSLNQLFRVMGFKSVAGSTGILLAYSFMLSLMGLVVFSLMISMINNSMARRFEALGRGDTAVLERDHVLILGWSNKVHTVIRQIAELTPGTKVVVLAPMEVTSMREALRVSGVDREKITIILRTGSVSNFAELERVAVGFARSVIVLASGTDDSETIKAIVLLAGERNWQAQPTLTAEIAQDRNVELATIAGGGHFHVVSSSTVISKILVQTVRNPGLAKVYSELMSRSGNNIHVQKVPGCEGELMAAVAHGFNQAIPIGVTWQEQTEQGTRHAVALNPEPDYDFAGDDQLVLLTSSYPARFSLDGSAKDALEVYDHPEEHIGVPDRILTIGWCGIVSDTLKEMDAHALGGTRLTLLVPSEMARATAERQLENLSFRQLSVDVRVGDPALAEAYDDLDLQSYGVIVLLADDGAGEEADTLTLRSLLRLSELRRYHDQRAHVVVELMDAGNRELLANLGVDDVVVSSEIVSAQLAQVAEQPVLGPIYRELLSAGGIEISIRPISNYAEAGVESRFAALVREAQKRQEILLGLARSGDASADPKNGTAKGEQIILNPGLDARWTLQESDRLVVLAQQVY